MNKDKLPFVTQNRALAIALHFGGCRIVDIWRVYEPEELKRLGKSAEHATINDQGGKVQFFLEDNDNRAALLTAFDSVTECEKLELPEVSNEDACRLAHLLLRFRREIDWWLRNPKCAKVIESGGEPTIQEHEDGSKTIVHPGARMHSATAPQTIIQHLRQ